MQTFEPSSLTVLRLTACGLSSGTFWIERCSLRSKITVVQMCARNEMIQFTDAFTRERTIYDIVHLKDT